MIALTTPAQLLQGVLLTACLAACKPDGPATALNMGSPVKPAAATDAVPTIQPKVSTMKLDELLTPGMPYALARQKLLDSGYVPVPDPQCKENVVGANWQDVCPVNPSLCEPCEKLPELSAYSGDGHMLAVFKDKTTNQIVNITGNGEISDWGVTDPDSKLQYSGWEEASTDSIR